MNTEIQEVQLNTYPVYKDSGVEWLEAIPEHWEVKRLKHLMKINNGIDYKHVQVDEGYPVIGSGGQFTYASKYLYDGEVVLLGRKGTIDKPLYFKGKFWTVDTMFYAVANRNAITKYLYYLSTVIPFKFYGTATALPSMTQDDLNNHKVAIPFLREQTAIVNFLDDKCSKIDAAVKIKQQQMTLLKERRQIAIHQAVTQGLDKNVPMKNSGVEWIGEIPEHWEVAKLKNHVDLLTGFPFKSEKYSNAGIKLARGINVKEGQFNWDQTMYWREIEDHLEKYLLKEGDVLIGMDGSKVGKNFCIVEEVDLPVLLLQRVARLRSKKTIDSRFLYSHIINRNFLQWVEITKTDPMIPHIAPKDIQNFRITIAPLFEQKKIVEFIEDFTNKTDTAISLYEQEIEKLKEYKTTLINSAVTGKIKVPGVN